MFKFQKKSFGHLKLFSDFIGSGHLDWRKEVLDMNLKETTEILLLCSMVLINQLVSSFNQLIEDTVLKLMFVQIGLICITIKILHIIY